jgi:BTB/POZ domain
LTLHRDLGTEIVQIFVWSKRELFQIHKKLICSVSEFFDKAFNDGFAEASKNQMELPEDVPDIFAMFVAWLYKGELNFEWDQVDCSKATAELIDLYLFANAKCSNRFKNIVMDTLQDGVIDEELFLGQSHLKRIFDGTCSPTEVPIRRFCVAYITYRLHLGLDEAEDVSDFFRSHPDAMTEYLSFQEACSTDIYEMCPWQRGASKLYHRCYFHVHGEEEECNSNDSD